MAVQKIKYPMDLTPDESAALTDAARQYGTSKKALIFAALKIAYGIEPGKPVPPPPASQPPATSPARPQ